jgi:hypothetical protein
MTSVTRVSAAGKSVMVKPSGCARQHFYLFRYRYWRVDFEWQQTQSQMMICYLMIRWVAVVCIEPVYRDYSECIAAGHQGDVIQGAAHVAMACVPMHWPVLPKHPCRTMCLPFGTCAGNFRAANSYNPGWHDDR